MMWAIALAAAVVSMAQLAPAPVGADVRAFGAIPDDGIDDTTAIQTAINAAGNGATILFPPGRFNITRTLDPRGQRKFQGATRLVWKGDTIVPENQTILSADGDHFLFYFSEGKDVAFQNLTFNGRAIFADRPNNGWVQGLTIDNCWFYLDVKGDRTNAVEFTTGLADSRITNSVFSPIRGDNGVYGYNWSNVVIANNHFLDGNEGIHLIAHDDASKNLLIEQNYFSGLRRMGVEIQGGGNNTVVQDNYYEKPVMTRKTDDNNDTFAYSIISDRSKGTRVRRNTSIAPERPDGIGVRIIFELGGDDVVCEDNYSVDGNHVAILNTSRNGKIVNNRFGGFREAASAYGGRAHNAVVQNNGPRVSLTWNINRGKPGPNKRLPTTRPAATP
jgi:hypothetical protein